MFLYPTQLIKEGYYSTNETIYWVTVFNYLTQLQNSGVQSWFLQLEIASYY